jgi:hypothetical protein
MEGNYEIDLSFSNLKAGPTARIRIPPKIQKIPAK